MKFSKKNSYSKTGFLTGFTPTTNRILLKQHPKRSARLVWGFTALEILISTAVLAILAALIAGAFFGFRDSRILDETSETMVNALREARSKTLASEKGKQFGVHFESTRVVIFSGQSFDENDPENESQNISGRVEIYNINFSGPDIVFKRLTGEASPAGDVSLRLKKDLSKTRTIYVNSAGLIYEE